MTKPAAILLLLLFSSPLYAAPATVPPIDTGAMARMLFGLVVVLALVIGMAWLAKKFLAPQRGPGGTIKVIAGAAVGQRERVVLVEINDTWLVVGVAPGNVRALYTMPKSEVEFEPAAAPETSFNSWLKQVIEKRNVR